MRAHRSALGALRRGIRKVGERRKPGPPPRAPKPRTSPEEAPERAKAPEPVDAGATKKDLYEVAKGLGIEGRSKMTKDELVRAIEEARRKTGKPRG